MKLFRLKTRNVSTLGYDVVDDVVVSAQHETHARKLVAADQKDNVWLTDKLVSCEILPIDHGKILVKHHTSG